MHGHVRYQLSSSTVFIPTADGVYLKNARGSMLLSGRHAIRLFDAIGPLLREGVDASRLRAVIGTSQADAVVSTLDTLADRGFLHSKVEGESPIAAERPTVLLSVPDCMLQDSEIVAQALGVRLRPMEPGTSDMAGDASRSQSRVQILIASEAKARDLGGIQNALRAGESLHLGVLDGGVAMHAPVLTLQGEICAECVLLAWEQRAMGVRAAVAPRAGLARRWLLSRLLRAATAAPVPAAAMMILREDLTTSSHAVKQDPLCGRCSLWPDPQHEPLVALMASCAAADRCVAPAESLQARLEAAAALRDREFGVLHSFDNGDFVQLPLCRTRAAFALGRSSSRRLVQVTSSGADHLEARRNALHDAILALTEVLATQTGRLHQMPTTHGMCMRENRPVAIAKDSIPSACDWAIGSTYTELARSSLLRALRRLLLRSSTLEVKEWSTAARDVTRWIDALARFDVTVRLVRVSNPLNAPAIGAVDRDGRIAVAVDTTTEAAARAALIELLSIVQAETYREPIDGRAELVRTRLQFTEAFDVWREPVSLRSLLEELRRSTCAVEQVSFPELRLNDQRFLVGYAVLRRE